MCCLWKRYAPAAWLLVCASAGRAQAPDARTAVLNTDTMYREAVLHGDAKALATLLADDILIVHSDGTTDTKLNFLDAIGSGRLKMRSYERVDVQLRLFGPVAVLFAKTKKVFAYKNTPGVDVDLSTVTFVKQGSEWKIAAMQNTHASK